MRIAFTTACLALLMQAGPTHAKEADGRTKNAVLALERARLDATVRHDNVALEKMTTADLTYVHASGIRQNQSQYLAYVAAGGVTFGQYSIDDEQVEIHGDAAVTHGMFHYTTDARVNPPHSGQTLFTAVYVRTAGQWQLSAWEATKAP
ncbi:nuclear transport factor 2 family protein [Sphingobium sp.]|uniref:nuclear transport factor 2 family protein n=1 Tax=Sphingobium sp. TaxID=1912891 RepID=UPI0028BD8691|nr:nuclear transport factor 2 family protein [Sphingobium sp.]